MNEKKGFYVSTKDIIIAVLVVVLVFWVAFEIFKIKHQMKFATFMEQQNRNTAWIQNVNRQAQQQRAVQQPVKPKEVPEKK